MCDRCRQYVGVHKIGQAHYCEMCHDKIISAGLNVYTNRCCRCKVQIISTDDCPPHTYQGDYYCTQCFYNSGSHVKAVTANWDHIDKSLEKEPAPTEETALIPKHYHKYDLDTFTFLEKGFKPEVLEGFLVGNVIKYVQRYELKNGLEDLEKANVYLNKLIEFKKKSLSK